MTVDRVKFLNTVVLGYRDFEEPKGSTISAHLDIIATKGGVWWGWWKKDSEPENINHLEKLQSTCDKLGSIPVGLFDRATGDLFIASCEQVIHSSGGNTSPFRAFTPAYYSATKLKAWFYFSDIKPIVRSDFEACFSKVPLSIESTFFPIVDGKMTDKDSFFIYHGDTLDRLKILHISDIHLGDDYGFSETNKPGQETIFSRLSRDKDSIMDGGPNLIIFSGDITTRSNIDIMRKDGLKFLERLSNLFRIERNRIIIVPGNHDLPLMKFVPTDYSHENEFRGLLKDFYQTDMSTSSMHMYNNKDGSKTQILAMNSVRLRNVDLKNFGYVQWSLYDEQLKGPSSPAVGADVIKLAVLHHHLIPVPYEDELDSDYTYASASATIDSGSVIEGLHNHDFRLVLHGHQHVPGVCRVARGRNDAKGRVTLDRELSIVSAGSLTSSRLANYMRNNSYNFVVKEENKFKVSSFEYTSANAPTRTSFYCEL